MLGNKTRGVSILLNIAIFIPVGYWLSGLKKHKWFTIADSALLTIIIESVQFVSCRGYFDVDDIISNTVGGALGVLFFTWIDGRKWNKFITIGFIIAGVFGCIIVSDNAQVYETQFDFEIYDVKMEGENINFSGICSIYRRSPLDYQIMLKSGDDLFTAETSIDGERFTAKAVVEEGKVYEVLAGFVGYELISTKTYLVNGTVEYVSNAPAPDVVETDLDAIVYAGTLKVYIPEYDVYVYQKDGRLYWLVGEEFDCSIIYHLHTDEPDNLPENRKQYGFDNRGFRAGSEKDISRTMNCGKYKVFTDIIPDDYHITAIMVGMNKGSNIIWRQYFRPNRF